MARSPKWSSRLLILACPWQNRRFNGTPDENAVALKALLDGEKSAYRDIVILNTAAALMGGCHAETLAEGAEKANSSIDTGAACAKLDQLIAITNG